MTTNKADLTEDMANRTSCVRILKQPAGHEFTKYPEGDLLNHVRAKRGEYLSAIFVVVGEWIRRGRPENNGVRHDFRAWAGKLDWIVQELLSEAPLLDGHDQARVRMTGGPLNWLRDVALALHRARGFGRWIKAGDIVDYLEDDGEINPLLEAAPGVELNAEDWRDRVLKGVGGKMRRCFFDEDLCVIDDIEIHRRVYQDAAAREAKAYFFQKVGSGAPPPIPDELLGPASAALAGQGGGTNAGGAGRGPVADVQYSPERGCYVTGVV
jgi:hypothetical protein